MRHTWFTALGALLALSTAASAQTFVIRVPADQPTITDALNNAFIGDSVLVAAGDYFENISLVNGVALFGGYDATYTVQDPAVNVTMIHGSGVGAAVTADAVGSATKVDGFLITGGGGMPGAGVIVNGGSPVFSNNEISGNRQAGIAGGVYIYGGSTVLFQDNDVSTNSSKGSGGGFHIADSSPTLIGNTISDNAAPHTGGALYIFNSAVYCSAAVMQNNRAGDGGGGAIRVQNTLSGTTIVDSQMDACTAPFGGAVLVKDASHVDLVNCDITNCSADPFGAASQTLGGGLAVFPLCSATLTDCRFDNCSATGPAGTAFGGAIYSRLSTVTFTGTDATDPNPTATMTNCSSDFQGGAVYATSATGSIVRVLIDGCTAQDLGGGLYLEETAYLVQENVIANCSANDGGGIAFYGIANVPPVSDVLSNTFYRCSSVQDAGGGAILHQGGNGENLATIAGNLISHTLNGACVRCLTSGGGTPSKPTIKCTTIHNDPANPNFPLEDGSCSSAFATDGKNREGDPLYCATMPYHLQDCSPDVNESCAAAAPGRTDRGAALSEVHCACGITTLEPATWGRLKSLYR